MRAFQSYQGVWHYSWVLRVYSTQYTGAGERGEGGEGGKGEGEGNYLHLNTYLLQEAVPSSMKGGVAAAPCLPSPSSPSLPPHLPSPPSLVSLDDGSKVCPSSHDHYMLNPTKVQLTAISNSGVCRCPPTSPCYTALIPTVIRRIMARYRVYTKWY